jgi:hypothetical protein
VQAGQPCQILTSLASERIARKPDQDDRKAGDVVTGQTCESPGERPGLEARSLGCEASTACGLTHSDRWARVEDPLASATR